MAPQSKPVKQNPESTTAQCLKITKNVAFEFLDFGILHQFCAIKSHLSGNPV